MNTADDAVPRASIVWRLDEWDSRDHVQLVAAPGGSALIGRMTLVLDGQPGTIDYSVSVGHGWQTRAVAAEVRLGGQPTRRVDVEVDNGRWSIDGVHDPTFDGCVDVDLGWTPATNLLPIRRLGLNPGETVDVETAWLRFPELEFTRGRQRYTRLDESTYRYQSGDFARDLTVDRYGFVTAYGDDLWQAVAST